MQNYENSNWLLSVDKQVQLSGKCDELWKIVICELNILKNVKLWKMNNKCWILIKLTKIVKMWKMNKKSWILKKGQNEWNPGNNWNWYKCIRKYLLLMKKVHRDEQVKKRRSSYFEVQVLKIATNEKKNFNI